MDLARSAQDSPVICGMGLRLPGGRTTDAAWNVLEQNRCTVTTVGTELFDPTPFLDPMLGRRGKSYTFACGRIDRAFHFDPGFFGISPREAAQIDPQQRLMLATAWEAAEDAGLDMAQLSGNRTGVFIGASLVEHLSPHFIDPGRIGSAVALGNELSIIANRISSTFGFEGPSLVLDTACSSGLFALHQAAAAIEAGEIDTAFVGGVHILRAPGGFIGFSQARMLSPTGLCQSFSEKADGYVRAEAAVMLVLQGARVAQKMQARLRATVLATGVGTDGASSPLMVPSAQRQEGLMAEVFARTAKDPEDITFYEAHGTGTAVGDPAEARSLGQALGQLRRQALLIGSAKTNFGHSEPAAGLVGVVKAVLAMEHRVLPASLHCTTPNPAIDFDRLNLTVNQANRSLGDGPLLAGVNSFGFGGTNAVAFLSGPETVASTTRLKPVTEPGWLLLSAQSAEGLGQLRTHWRGLENDAIAVAAAGTARSELTHRIACEGPSGRVVQGQVSLPGAQSVLAFGGNGAQVVGMGLQRYRDDPVWRAVFDDFADAFAMQGVQDLSQILHAADLGDRFRSPLVAQPLLVACMAAEAEALIAAGLRPHTMIGHSIGELVALHLAGAFDRAALAQIVTSRSRAFETLRGTGGMAVVALTEAEVQRALAALDSTGLVIAAVNGPRSVTLSGPIEALDRFSRLSFGGNPVAILPVGVEVPYHSPALDPLHKRFLHDVAGLVLGQPKMPVASATRGRMLRAGEINADFLWDNARAPVRFADALRALVADRPALLIEVSPKPVLASHVRDLARHEGLAMEHAASMTLDTDRPLASVAALWTRGARIDRPSLTGQVTGPAPALPLTPMVEAEYLSAPSADAIDGWGERSGGVLAGIRPLPDYPLWLADFTPTAPAWVADHKIGDRLILPLAILAEVALSAGAELWPKVGLELSSFNVLIPAEVSGDGLRLRTEIDATDGQVTLSVRPRLVDAEWAVLARGFLRRSAPVTRHAAWKPFVGPDASPAPAANKPHAGSEVYAKLAKLGLNYGPTFRRLLAVRPRNKGSLHIALSSRPVVGRFALDAIAMDAAFHALATLPQAGTASVALVPVRIGQLQLHRQSAEVTSAVLHHIRQRGQGLTVDIDLLDGDGLVVSSLRSIEFARLPDPSHTRPIERWVWRPVLLRLPGQALQLPRRTLALAMRKVGFAPATRPEEPVVREENGHELLRDGLERAPEALEGTRAKIAARRGGPLPEVEQASQENRAAWEAAVQVLTDLARRWPKGERLCILAVGMPPPGIVAQLLTLARDGLTLHHPDPAYRTALRQTLPEALRPHLRDRTKPKMADIAIGVGPDLHEEYMAAGGINLRFCAGEFQSGKVATNWYREEPLPLTASAWRNPVDEKATIAPRNRSTLTDLIDGAKSRWRLCRYDLSCDDQTDKMLAQVLADLRMGWDGPAPLILLTGPAEQLDLLAPAVAAALRCLCNEAPKQTPRLVSQDPEAAERAVDWSAILTELEHEPVLHLRGETVLVDRLQLLPPEVPCAPALRLHQPEPGRLDHLRWEPARRRAPGPHEVEVAVAATGLNFRDVMMARGLLPERMFDGGASGGGLGLEWSGHVLRAGAQTGLVPGTPVFGLAGRAFATHLTLPATQVHQVPPGISLLAAAGLPVASLTAWDALLGVARLTAGESVLVHGGAGGVGLAAIRLARATGARVFATASTPEKRAVAIAAGALASFDSRTDSFVEGLHKATAGRGVDVILNSLSGSLMRRSLACLAPFGRFVELGKRDFAEASRISLEDFGRGQSYHSYDLDQRMAAMPDRLRPAFAALTTGENPPLPITRFAAEEAGLAMAHMLASRHVGKIVVTAPHPKPARKTGKVRGAWVILGGTGGIGLAVARHLLRRGAAQVHLVSRSGEFGLVADGLDQWANAEPRITRHALDAGDPIALGSLLGEVAPEGVVHAAMVLRDRMVRDLDPIETALVLRAKLGVAQAIEAILREGLVTPRHVVFFTSAAATLGNPGQSVYAAANGAVESIVAALRRDGLPGRAIALGPVSDQGVLNRDARLLARLRSTPGVGFLTTADLLVGFDQALAEDGPAVWGIGRFGWSELAQALPALGTAAFGDVMLDRSRQSPIGEGLVAALTDGPWGVALERTKQEVQALIASILRMPADEVKLQHRLSDYGLDSLTALELRIETERRFGVSLSSLTLSANTTGAKLAVQLLHHLRGGDD